MPPTAADIKDVLTAAYKDRGLPEPTEADLKLAKTPYYKDLTKKAADMADTAKAVDVLTKAGLPSNYINNVNIQNKVKGKTGDDLVKAIAEVKGPIRSTADDAANALKKAFADKGLPAPTAAELKSFGTPTNKDLVKTADSRATLADRDQVSKELTKAGAPASSANIDAVAKLPRADRAAAIEKLKPAPKPTPSPTPSPSPTPEPSPSPLLIPRLLFLQLQHS
jgi:hypothetical protein